MGIPDEDKLGSLCRQDMNKIESSVSNIRSAITAVNNLIGCETWVGPAADKWGTDFQGRMGALSKLFDSYPAEENRLVTKAQEKQASMDRKRTGGGA
ncbi:hypothetical protein BFF78_18230 [Streptomyces fodineus]|uniref:Uncharacterized protein n=1 Tax=Streptomyces fodineus TaxID=1904616 RepID=A0A1D7YB62_9ACTN|nr:hypothetical protein [Streptomyces fodineus]AOR32744.1 hypothetical protein BFF78_18230 [Streptomyces fodineus]